jgi:hypothetical protein
MDEKRLLQMGHPAFGEEVYVPPFAMVLRRMGHPAEVPRTSIGQALVREVRHMIFAQARGTRRDGLL